MNTTLYMKGRKGEIRIWRIRTLEDGLVMEFGTDKGFMQTKCEDIFEGKSNRTVEEQITSRYNSRINKMFDKGYKETLQEAMQGRTNGIGLINPMLAKQYSHVKEIDWRSAYYQHKYDGNRCIVTKLDGKIIAYSRNGKLTTGIEHILSGIDIDEGESIDGELYCHGIPLQTINSWIKKKQESTKNLSLRVYDLISKECYTERLIRLRGIELGDSAYVVDSVLIRAEDQIKRLLNFSITHGYEGGIIRWGEEGYEDGARSNHLVKIKIPNSMESEVIDIIPSADGWARLVLDCGVTVSCHGPVAYKHKVMREADEYIGKILTINHYEWTKSGKPFHPVAISFREDL